MGSIRSSLWRGGSIAHGPKPRDYAYAIPAKMLRGALRSALAAKFQDQKLTVIDQFNLQEAKTKAFAGALRKLGVEKSVLVVSDATNRNLELSSRNIQGCDLVRHHKLHPYEVLSHETLLISEGALGRLAEALHLAAPDRAPWMPQGAGWARRWAADGLPTCSRRSPCR